MTQEHPKDDLSGKLNSEGWQLVADDKDEASGTLEDVARAAHRRHKSGKPPGLIRQIETTLELDIIALERVWTQLGLPL